MIDFKIAFAVWWRNASLYRRTWKMNILPNFFEPMLYLVGMGVGLGSYVGQGMGGVAYIAFIAPGLLMSAAMNGAVFETTYNMFIKMHFNRTYDAYLSTPAMMQDIVAGELMWAMTRSSIYGAAFLTVVGAMSFFDYPILQSWWVLALPFLILLVGLMFGLIGALATSFIKIIDMYSYFFTLFLTPLFLFSGIFFPISRFPYGEEIAWCTPLFHAVRASRGFCSGEVGGEVLVSMIWMVTFCAILAVWVPRRMSKILVD